MGMNATELIKELQGFVEAHGDDLEVYIAANPEAGEGATMQPFVRVMPDPDDAYRSPEVLAERARQLPQPQEQVKGKGDFRRAMDLLEQGFD